MLIGFYIAGLITDAYIVQENMHDWKSIWIFPALFALGVLVLFSIFFKNERVDKNSIEI